MIKWGIFFSGLGALVVIAIMGVLIASGDASGSTMSHGVWLVAFLPLIATIGGAIVLAGQED